MNKETRAFSGAVEIRKAENGADLISGGAVVYNVLSQALMRFNDGTFLYERIKDDAFDECDMSDVYCLRDHEDDYLLGRSVSGTLRLSKGADGISYECDAPNTTAGRDTVEYINRRDISGSSFSWPKDRAYWDYDLEEDDNGNIIRTITKVKKLLDVGPVQNPAYPQTSTGVTKRSFLEEMGKEAPEGAPEKPELAKNTGFWKRKVSNREKYAATFN